MPNFQGRYLKQGTVGNYGNESLPNIKGSFAGVYNGNGLGGAFNAAYSTTAQYPESVVVGTQGVYAQYYFNATLSSSTYQTNAKINPDNAEILYCIKY